MNDDKENLRRDVSLMRAESVFKDAVGSFSVKLTDPSRIHEEMSNLKDLSKKLKFQFMEQETRDRFLRYMLLDHEREVSPSEMKQTMSENEESKARLKETKADIQLLLSESEDISDEVIKLNREFEKRQAEVDAVMLEVDQLQEELGSLMNAPDNKDYKALYELGNIENFGSIGIEDVFDLARKAVALEADEVEEARNQVASSQAEIIRNSEMQSQLESQLNNIFEQIQTAEQLQSEPVTHPEQIYAQTLLEANKVLQRFIGTAFVLDVKSETLELKIKGTVIVLDKDMNILLLKDVSPKAIEIINCTKTDKFWRLLRLLSHIVLE